MSKEKETHHVNCPRCGKTVAYVPGQRDSYFPFCSRKCKMLDLGNWFEEKYRISSEETDRAPRGDGDDGEVQ